MPDISNIGAVHEMDCARCGKPAHAIWDSCADQERPVCRDCDIALNELLLRWMGIPEKEASRKLSVYRAKAAGCVHCWAVTHYTEAPRA